LRHEGNKSPFRSWLLHRASCARHRTEGLKNASAIHPPEA
jgi:hypothetical protein